LEIVVGLSLYYVLTWKYLLVYLYIKYWHGNSCWFIFIL